jgi:hypothetical protein
MARGWRVRSTILRSLVPVALVIFPALILSSARRELLGHLSDRLEAVVIPARCSDRARYAIHAAIGRAIVSVLPTEAGLQWFKAAAHARTETQMREAGAGLRAALAAGASVVRLEATISQEMGTEELGAQMQRNALAIAGLVRG